MAARTVAAFAQPSVLLLCMAARTVATFAQPSVLLLCMAARTVAALIMSGAFFFEQGII
jgi:hypothetical protein